MADSAEMTNAHMDTANVPTAVEGVSGSSDGQDVVATLPRLDSLSGNNALDDANEHVNIDQSNQVGQTSIQSASLPSISTEADPGPAGAAVALANMVSTLATTDDFPIDPSLIAENGSARPASSAGMMPGARVEEAILRADEQVLLDSIEHVQTFVSDQNERAPAPFLNTTLPEAAVDADMESVLTSPLGSTLSTTHDNSTASSGSNGPLANVNDEHTLSNTSTLDKSADTANSSAVAASSTSQTSEKPVSTRSTQSHAAMQSGTRVQRQRTASSRSVAADTSMNVATEGHEDAATTTSSASLSRRSGGPRSRKPPSASSSNQATSAAGPSRPSIVASSTTAGGGTSRTRSLALQKEQKEKDAEAKAARAAARRGRRGRRDQSVSSSDEESERSASASASASATATSRNGHDHANAHSQNLVKVEDLMVPDMEVDDKDAAQSGRRRRSTRAVANATNDKIANPSGAYGRSGGLRATIGEEEEDVDGDEGVTRCICGITDEDAGGFMIQCETCKVWQHGQCVGFKTENLCPDTYYCELCRPDLHPTLHRKKHGRTNSSSTNRPVLASSASDQNRPASPGAKPISRDRGSAPLSLASPALPQQPQPPTMHRARSSADASIIATFLDQSKGSHSPSPGSPGASGASSGSLPLAADGKRPMYPATSHLSAPLSTKRRSTMNSRESAAFDESIMLANANAIKESKAMAAAAAHPGSGAFDPALSLSAQTAAYRKRRKLDDLSPDVTMDTVKEEEGEEADVHNLLDADDALEAGPNDEADGDIQHEEDGDAPPARKRARRGGVQSRTAARGSRRGHTSGKSRSNQKGGDDGDAPNQADGEVDAEDSATAGQKRKRTAGQPNASQTNRALGAPEDAAAFVTDNNSSSESLLVSGDQQSSVPLARNSLNTSVDRNNDAEAQDDDVLKGPSAANDPEGELPLSVRSSRENMTASARGSDAATLPASTPNGQQDKEIASQAAEVFTAPGQSSQPNQAKNGKNSASSDEDSATTSVAGTAPSRAKGRGYGFRGRGGPGSRGGRGSPSKRGGWSGSHTAAEAARRGQNRDDTPSGEDFLNTPPTWGLPDHFSHLQHLLPTPTPQLLQIPIYKCEPDVEGANHYRNERKISPSTLPSSTVPETISSESAVAAETTADTAVIAATKYTPTFPPAPPTSAAAGHTLEGPAKIKFPTRRMSLAEMKKRTTTVLEYITKLQVESAERANRNRTLGLLQERFASSADSTAASPTSSSSDGPAAAPIHPVIASLRGGRTSSTAASRPSELRDTATRSANLLAELSKQLVGFQEKFL